MNNKPYIWQMIKEAVEELGGTATYSDIKDYIKDKYRERYEEISESSVDCTIISCSVNHIS